MGLIERVLQVVFGNGRNVVKDTVEVFRENADAGAARDAEVRAKTLSQFGSEFVVVERGWFDRLMDALNRLPRPALAFGTLGLFIAAMVDPVWFASRMQGIALVPEPLWWLLGAIVTFYFGARHQSKRQDYRRQITDTLVLAPQVVSNLAALGALERGAGRPGAAATGHDSQAVIETLTPDENPALNTWRRSADFGR